MAFSVLFTSEMKVNNSAVYIPIIRWSFSRVPFS